MTTPLVKALTREILVSGTAYKVTIAADRLTLRRKGARKALEVTWDDVLLIEQRTAETSAPVPATAVDNDSKSTPGPVLNGIARELRAAASALATVDEMLTHAGAMPAALMARVASDPLYGRAEPADHWFVEPLFTIVEVASILRVSTKTVRRLPLRAIVVAGETRYQQSAIREYVRDAKSTDTKWRRWSSDGRCGRPHASVI